MYSHRRAMDEAALRVWIRAVSGQSSLRRLTVVEASRLIDALRDASSTVDTFIRQTAQRRPAMISAGQQWIIDRLTADLGWNPHQVMGLAHRMYGRIHRESLTQEQASGLIEALKAIRDRWANALAV
jgi:hypothetical protein